MLANLVLGLVVALGFIAGNLDVAGSLVTGAAVAAAGISFLGVGLLAAQFMITSRGANAVAAGLVGAAYIVRGLGDALGTPSADGLQRDRGLAELDLTDRLGRTHRRVHARTISPRCC